MDITGQGQGFFWATERSKKTGRLRVRRVRFETDEERRDKRLDLLAQVIEAYPYTYHVPGAAMNRWGNTIRRAGASAVAVPTTPEQRLLFLSGPMGLTCGNASDQDLCVIARIKTNKRITYIGPKLISAYNTTPQVSEVSEWRRLGHKLAPRQVREAALVRRIATFTIRDGGVMTERGLTPAHTFALIHKAEQL